MGQTSKMPFTNTVQFLALIGWFLSSLREQSDKIGKTRTCTRFFMQMSYLYASDLPFKNLIYSRYLTSFGSCYCKKNKLTSLFYASVLLLKITFVITLSKFAAEPLAHGSWFHSHFDNVMTQFIINKRTDA